MTDEKIELLLLRHLDPDHEELGPAPVRQVTERLGWLVRQGYIVTADPPPAWMDHGAIRGVCFRRSAAGSARLMELLERIP